MAEGFRAAPGIVLKPSSLLPDGSVIDYLGERSFTGPCFVPIAALERRPARKSLLGRKGWCLTPARDWPSVLPRQGVVCIHRPEPA